MVNGGVVSPAVSSSKTYTVSEPEIQVNVSASSLSMDHLSILFSIVLSHSASSLAPAVGLSAVTSIQGKV